MAPERFLRPSRPGAASSVALCLCLLAQPLVGCAEPGGAAGAAAADAGAAAAPAPPAAVSPDLLPAPAVFEATGTAVWDGRRTLQGVWVAHPQASAARRVRIYNTATGAAADGALFARDAILTGPTMLVSSDAARLLGLAPGEEAGLRVVAVTPRAAGAGSVLAAAPAASAQTAAAPSAATSPAVTGSAAGPVPAARSAEARAAPSPLPPSAAASAAAPPRASASPAAPAGATTPQAAGRDADADTATRAPAPAPPAVAAARPAPADTGAEAGDRRAAGAAPGEAPRAPAQPYVQAGLFVVAGNAERLIQRLEAAGLPALGRPVQLATGPATRVLAGPFATAAERDAARRRIRAMGLDDAVPVAR